MELRTEKEVLIDDLNRANKLCEEATLNYMNMCKQVEVLEKCVDEIKNKIKGLCKRCALDFKVEDANSIPNEEYCDDAVCYYILEKIKEAKGDE